MPQYVTKISVNIPTHKIDTKDFYLDEKVDLEKAGVLSSDYREFPPDYDLSVNTGRHPNATAGIDRIGDEDADEKLPFGHKLFDAITRHAGSRWVLLITVLLLLGWAFLGAALGPTDIWQITLQNASSIQVYLTDILLIRQQHTSSRSLLKTLAKMQARDRTHARLIQEIPLASKEEVKNFPSSESTKHSPLCELVPQETHASRSEAIFDESCRIIASGLGSVWAYIIYWIGIFVWVGTGKLLDFSDEWQLYINTAVALALTFTSIFLQNRQQQQEDTLDRALEYSTKIDKEIEFRLREMTGDRIVNDVIPIETRKLGWIEKGVDWFAFLMGSVWGVLITVVVFVVWFIVGPLLQFDDNWWLIIGTFTGLVGFVDGFVLRNIYAREATAVNHELENIATADNKVFSYINVSHDEISERKLPLSSRISGKVGDWCASNSAALASVLFVFGLLAAATAMRWTTTGQLLCNTPTMIIEGFFLLVLIEAHCIAVEIRERYLRNILEKRLILNRYLRERMVESQVQLEKPGVVVQVKRLSSSRSSSSSSLRSFSSPSPSALNMI